MGTSKGYIAPSTPHWAHAKRNISTYVGNPTESGQRHAAIGYAKAMNTDGFSGSRAAHAFSGLSSFASSSSTGGIVEALQEIGREDILALPSEDALNELMLHFASNGDAIDDVIALDCISEAFTVLEVYKLEDLQNIETNKLIKELVCQFAKQKFAQLFDKQIRNKCPNVEQANSRIAEMQKYIYYTMELKLTDDVLAEINPHNLSDETIIHDTLTMGFELMERYYGD